MMKGVRALWSNDTWLIHQQNGHTAPEASTDSPRPFPTSPRRAPRPPFSRKGSDPSSSPPDERGGVRHGASVGGRGCGDGGAGRLLGPYVLHTGQNEQEEREGECFFLRYCNRIARGEGCTTISKSSPINRYVHTYGIRASTPKV